MTYPDPNRFFNCKPNVTNKFICKDLKAKRPSLETTLVCCKNITTVDNGTIVHGNCSPELCSKLSGNDLSTPVTALIIICLLLILLLIFCIFATIWILKKKYKTTTTNIDNNRGSLDLTTDEYVTLNNVVPDVANTGMEDTSTGLPSKNIQKLLSALNNPDGSMISSRLTLKEQTNVIPYDPKLEIGRQHFTIKEMLGSGNFGTVFKGETIGLFYPGSKTNVAVKTINDNSSWRI